MAEAALACAPSNAHPNALPAGRELLEYRIVSCLSEDGFGLSYLARDTVLQRDVALKEYFPSDLARRMTDGRVASSGPATESSFRKGLNQFLVEARVLSRFVHPNIGAWTAISRRTAPPTCCVTTSTQCRSRTSSPAGRGPTKRH